MKQWFLTDSLKDISAKKLVKEPQNIPHVISPVILAENFAGKKKTNFWSELDKQTNIKVESKTWWLEEFWFLLNIDSKYV